MSSLYYLNLNVVEVAGFEPAIIAPHPKCGGVT